MKKKPVVSHKPDWLDAKLEDYGRRNFIKQVLSVGSLGAAAAVVIAHPTAISTMLAGMSKWNDGAQGLLFSTKKLAPVYERSMLTQPFPFNAYYGIEDVVKIDPATYKLEVSGLVGDSKSWSVKDLRGLPQESAITRLICVEGWSAIGEWGGVPLGYFLRRVGADLTAKYIGFKCADGYYSSMDMATALHPQTLLALDFMGKPLTPEYGAPMRVRVPTKLGFKNPKHVMAMTVTNTYPGGYWEDQGNNWFSGS